MKMDVLALHICGALDRVSVPFSLGYRSEVPGLPWTQAPYIPLQGVSSLRG